MADLSANPLLLVIDEVLSPLWPMCLMIFSQLWFQNAANSICMRWQSSSRLLDRLGHLLRLAHCLATTTSAKSLLMISHILRCPMLPIIVVDQQWSKAGQLLVFIVQQLTMPPASTARTQPSYTLKWSINAHFKDPSHAYMTGSIALTNQGSWLQHTQRCCHPWECRFCL